MAISFSMVIIGAVLAIVLMLGMVGLISLFVSRGRGNPPPHE